MATRTYAANYDRKLNLVGASAQCRPRHPAIAATRKVNDRTRLHKGPARSGAQVHICARRLGNHRAARRTTSKKPGPRRGYDPTRAGVRDTATADNGRWGAALPRSRAARRSSTTASRSRGFLVDGYRPDGSLSSACSIATAAGSSPSSDRPTLRETGTSATASCSPTGPSSRSRTAAMCSGDLRRRRPRDQRHEDGPRPVPIGQLAFAGGLPLSWVPLGEAGRILAAAGLLFFTWLASRNRAAVFAFNETSKA